MMAFMGVRSSWLMLARNWLLATLAASAASLATRQCFFAELRQGHGQMAREPLPQGNRLEGEQFFAPVVQLQQSQSVLAEVQGYQGHRLVTFPVTTIARAPVDRLRRWWPAVL